MIKPILLIPKPSLPDLVTRLRPQYLTKFIVGLAIKLASVVGGEQCMHTIHRKLYIHNSHETK